LLQRILSEEQRLAVSVKLILFGDVALDDGGVTLMEISQQLQQLLIRFINATNEIGKLVLLEVLAESTQTVLHEFVHLDRIVTLVRPVDCQTDRTDQTPVTAVSIYADKSWILAMRVAVVGLYEVTETLREVLHVNLHRHNLYNFIINTISS
jgi:hypothetical protein